MNEFEEGASSVMSSRRNFPKSNSMPSSEKNHMNGNNVILTIDVNNERIPSRPPSFGAIHPAAPESPVFSPTAAKPPKIPAATTNESPPMVRRRSFNRSTLSKPKSRFVEQLQHPTTIILEEDNPTVSRRASRTNSITTQASSFCSKRDYEEYDHEVYKKVTVVLSKKKYRKVKAKVMVEWATFGVILGFLVASLTVGKLQTVEIWSLKLWKWCLLVMVIFSGMLVTNWVMHLAVFLIERNFLLRKKVLYFVHGLKKSVQVFIWLSMVLLTWVLMFRRQIEHRSELSAKIMKYTTLTLTFIIIGSLLWLLKTLFVKILASNFHVSTFFDRIQESIFHHYVLQTLSGPPLIEEAEKVGREPSSGRFSFRRIKKGKEKKKVIDMGKIHKMKQEKVTAWTMKMLIDAVTTSGLSTISNTLEESAHGDDGGEHEDKEIKNEMEAMAAAYRIFNNVAQPGHMYIEEDDLRRFMIKEEVDLVLPLIDGVAETGKIDLKALTSWVVKVYQGRKALAHALTDTKTAVRQLNNLMTCIVVGVTIMIWLFVTEIASNRFLALLSAQFLAASFMFKDTCKSVFEAIIFVFIMHPFDVGDRCVIEGEVLLVEEMNILSTIFLKLNNEKVYYPNSVLSTKPISNYLRSPEMRDNVQFSIDFMTPIEKIGALKERIKKYLEENRQHWLPNHNVVVLEIENVNKIKMALYINHTINFQDMAEKTRRRTELVLEMKKMFHDLNIRCNLLPQQINLHERVKETIPAAPET